MGVIVATSVFVLITFLGSWDIVRPDFTKLKAKCPFSKSACECKVEDVKNV